MIDTITFDIPEIPFFIFAGYLIVMALMGTIMLSRFIVTTVKIRRGYFGVRWIEKNHQEREKLVKPSGESVEIDGRKRPFKNDSDHYVLRGAKKIIAFSRLGNLLTQVRFAGLSKVDKDAPSEELFNDMLHDSEEWGKRQTYQPQKWKDYALIIIVVGLLGVAFLQFTTLGTVNQLPNQNATTSIVGSAVKDAITPFSDRCFSNATAQNITILNR